MKKVMVVDDSLFIRSIIKGIFTQNGYEVVAEAANGLDAIDKYFEYTPDLVTMDLTMPVLDGVEASKKILELDPKANIFVVSAINQEKYVCELLDLGIKDFIVKPINPELFISSVANFLKN